MRNPIDVLISLQAKSCNKMYRYERLYRNLYNPEFYLIAYRNIAASQGSMTAGADGMTLDGMSMARIERVIGSLKDLSYQPHPARRVYIDKRNSTKKRPLGIPSTDDRLVQEVVRMLLEAIYEPTFSPNSHGFRPKCSCHTALLQIERVFTGVKWFVEGDIKACFDSFDHHVLIGLLRRRIQDERFIGLMWKFLKAGYMEQWTYHTTYSGTPQGSGISPLLANIFLNELDEFMAGLKQQFDVADSYRRNSHEYENINGKLAYWRRKRKQLEGTGETEEYEKSKAQEKALMEQLRKTPCYPAIDPRYKKLQYNRYADDFLVGVIGSREDAGWVKTKVGDFLRDTLKLTLSVEKTKITHSAEKVRYLGFDITVSRSQDAKRDKNGVLVRRWSGQVKLYMPKDKWVGKLHEYGAFKIRKHADGSENWHPTARGKLMNCPDIEIISKYNSEIRGLYNFYRIAGNVARLYSFCYIMQYSMMRTFAAKYSTRVGKIKDRYLKNGIFCVSYETKSGTKQCEWYHDGFKVQSKAAPEFVDTMPQHRNFARPNSLAKRMLKNTCELCGKTNAELSMHHVKSLKQLTGATEWECKMIEMRRKTLAVCPECFQLMQE